MEQTYYGGSHVYAGATRPACKRPGLRQRPRKQQQLQNHGFCFACSPSPGLHPTVLQVHKPVEHSPAVSRTSWHCVRRVGRSTLDSWRSVSASEFTLCFNRGIVARVPRTPLAVSGTACVDLGISSVSSATAKLERDGEITFLVLHVVGVVRRAVPNANQEKKESPLSS